MQVSLKGQTALITGSTEGIGYAIADVFAESGAKVIINGRTPEKVEVAASELKKSHPESIVTGVAADLSSEEGAVALRESVSQVDILVNNVGIFEQTDFFQISDPDWDRMFQVNVMSGVRLSRLYLSQMLEKNRGRIIFISSETGVQSPPDMIHYGMSKTAQLAVSRGLAELTRGSQVTVNTVLPGPTKTQGVQDFVKRMAEEKKVSLEEVEKEFFDDYRPTSLLRRFSDPKEVAYTVAFLSSPLAASTNGATIRVEGGILRSIY